MRNKDKSFGNIVRLLSLLTLKEGYTTLKNILGIFIHPFKTINEIKKENNHSQTIIIPAAISSPFTLAIFVSGLYLALKYILKLSFPTIIGAGIKTLLTISAAYIIFVFVYLSFWTLKVVRKKGK